jgi:uncharacterized protein DUF4440
LKIALSIAIAFACVAFGFAVNAVPVFLSSKPVQLELSRVSVTPAAGELRSQLEDLEKQSWVAWKNRDGAFFERFLSEDHVELGPRGASNKAEVVATVNSPRCVVASFAVDTFSFTQFNEDTAMLAYHARQDTECSGKPLPSPVWVSSLYVKRNDRWLSALYQQTPAAE